MVGDIVLTDFDFTDRSGSKRRPVLVVADAGLPGMEDWIVCELTSQPGRPGDVGITQQDIESGRLYRDSWVRPSQLRTLEAKLLSRPVAHVTTAKLNEVLAAIRELFPSR